MFQKSGRSKPYGSGVLSVDGNFECWNPKKQPSKDADYEFCWRGREEGVSKVRRIWLSLRLVGCKHEGSLIGPCMA